MRLFTWLALACLFVALVGVTGCDSATASRSSSGLRGEGARGQGGARIQFEKKGNAGPASGGDT